MIVSNNSSPNRRAHLATQVECSNLCWFSLPSEDSQLSVHTVFDVPLLESLSKDSRGFQYLYYIYIIHSQFFGSNPLHLFYFHGRKNKTAQYNWLGDVLYASWHYLFHNRLLMMCPMRKCSSKGIRREVWNKVEVKWYLGRHRWQSILCWLRLPHLLANKIKGLPLVLHYDLQGLNDLPAFQFR